jgi:seryl-tRNA synthetase
MLDLRFIRENAERVRQVCEMRGIAVDVDRLLVLDERRRERLGEQQQVRERRNELAKAMKGRKPSDAEREEGKRLKDRDAELEGELTALTAELDVLHRLVPNVPRPDVPPGRSEEDNVEVRRWGTPPSFDFTPLDHLELGERHDLIDFEAGARVTGQKFYFLRNEAVLLEQALVRFALETARAHGFTLVQTPDLARTEVAAGTGFNPQGPETQVYSIPAQDLVLIGTAEITLSGLHRDEILEPERLPLRYCGVSHCFRTEAGSAGRESKGLYRVHQFTKVELFAFTHPDESDAMQERILAIEEEIFQKLEIPYRVMLLCPGESAVQSARTYDVEAWMPGRGEGGAYGEVTSASNCTDYQARRLNIRFRDAEARRTRFVHMLNGTALAMSRTPIVLLENHQRRDGSVRIPPALVPYLGFDRIGG